jgi:hypothetical protein
MVAMLVAFSAPALADIEIDNGGEDVVFHGSGGFALLELDGDTFDDDDDDDDNDDGGEGPVHLID